MTLWDAPGSNYERWGDDGDTRGYSYSGGSYGHYLDRPLLEETKQDCKICEAVTTLASEICRGEQYAGTLRSTMEHLAHCAECRDGVRVFLEAFDE